MIALLAPLALCTLCLGQDTAERLRVRGPSPALVRLGDVSTLVLEVEPDGTAVPAAPQLPQVDGLRLQMRGPSTETFQSIINGRLRQRSQVTWQVSIQPLREGKFTLPPFDVPVGRSVARTKELALEAIKDTAGAEHGFLDVTVEPRSVYVHEPIRVRFDYGIDNRLQVMQGRTARGETYNEVELSAPWLDDLEGGVPIEVAPPRRENAVTLVANQRTVRVEYDADHLRNGQAFHHFQLERAYLPTRSGRYELAAPVLRYTVQEPSRQRDFFGNPIAQPRNHYVYGKPIEIEVKPIPEAGRPDPYFGAVGRFEIAARLDRSRVKVGNSVQLTVSISGKGNTEFLRVPELGAVDGLHLLGTKEKREPELVEVTYDLTPLRADIREIPALRWNYFDTTPGVEKFVEVATEPQPLVVEPLAEGETLKLLATDPEKPVVPGVDDIHDIKALEAGEPARAAASLPTGALLAAVLLPWLAVAGLAFALRRRAAALADVAGRRERGALRRFERAVTVAPADALVAYLADRLNTAPAAVIGPDLSERLAAAGVPVERAQAVAGAVEAGVAARYGGGGGVDADTARGLVRELERIDFSQRPPSRAGVAIALTLAALGLGASPAAAQDALARERFAQQYRAGDYAAAAATLAAALEGPAADRRAFYNLGNALYRQGELAQALVAYERARLGLPRDPQVLANIALTRRNLELGTGEGEPFLTAVSRLRERFSDRELALLCGLCHAGAALCLVLGWRRAWLRAAGFLALVPALALSIELLWLAPARPLRGIVTAARGEVVAEPRDGLEALFKVKRGAEVAVLGEGPKWTRVLVQGREGYLPSAAVGVIR
jgi:hypothetical protein